MNYGNSKRAFTLAEILISLTIIGVVAAITIPSLTGKTNSKQFAATYKKAFSTIGQALKLGAADGKDASMQMSSTDLQLTAGKILQENVGARKLNTAWTIKVPTNSAWALGTNNILVPNSSVPGDFTLPAGSETYVLKDGLAHIIIAYPNSGRCYSAGKPIYTGDQNNPVNYSGSYCAAFIDVNGAKGPNQVITCDNQSEVMPEKFTLNITSDNCTLTSESITDIYPIVIYDDKILPATPAAAAVLEDRF